MSWRPPSTGRGLAAAGLSDELRTRLAEHGVVTCAQLHEVLERRGNAETCERLFGVSLDEARATVGEGVRRALGTRQARELRQHRFTAPPLKGLRGPTSESPKLMQRRASRQDERKRVVRFLEGLKAADSLPTSSLLVDHCARVGNQGMLGSCTGWGSTANREFLVEADLAPLFAYALAKHFDGEPLMEGSWQQFCFEGFARIGHLRERDYPYTDCPSDLDVQPYASRAREFLADGYSDVLLDDGDLHLQPTLMKAVLSGRLTGELGPQPLSTSLALYESFDAASTSLYGLVTVPTPNEYFAGGHAMCVVGHLDADDPNGLYGVDWFIVRNSWGTGWASQNPLGLAGHCLIPAAYFASPKLHWECLVCLAEPSPMQRRSRGLVGTLAQTWKAPRTQGSAWKRSI